MDKDLVKLFRESKETPDEMLTRLRYEPPERLDELYSFVIRGLKESGKAERVFSILSADTGAAMTWLMFDTGKIYLHRCETIRKMSPAERGRAVHGLAKTMHTHATLSPRVTFDPSRVDWWALALTVVYGKFPPFQTTAHYTQPFEAYTVDR